MKNTMGHKYFLMAVIALSLFMNRDCHGFMNPQRVAGMGRQGRSEERRVGKEC